MNIRDAKEQIQNAITAYFSKDEDGCFIIPPEKQRPVFLIGPPGIGKTAIMEQIASELGVGLLSYSMTHHTRQSALGLPFIERKVYGGKEYAISEYTMSEIIASIYDMMEETKVKEGILFLDEINCVSETLSPIMLQFLQYKVFGRHRVPEGWIVVTAGNPPEYNDSVREFDMVTWDRLKRIDVEADFEVWKEYAYKMAIHPAIMSYLDIKKDHFYKVESSVEGKSFVTARGWDDLSQMIILYEKNDIEVDKKLISQYLQNEHISSDFAIYYDLFNKYKSDYQVDKIINGEATDEIVQRAKTAKFDERLSLIALLIEGINEKIRFNIEKEEIINNYKNVLLVLKSRLNENSDLSSVWKEIIDEKSNELEKKSKSNSISIVDKKINRKVISIMQDNLFELNKITDIKEGFEYLKSTYEKLNMEYKDNGKEISTKLSYLFKFFEDAFEYGNEIIILVSELSVNYYAAKFINNFGSKEYFKYNKDLLIYEKQKDIVGEIEKLNLNF